MATNSRAKEKSLVKIDLSDGTEIYIQTLNAGIKFGKASGEKLSFESVFESIKSLSSQLKDLLNNIGPKEAEIEFSIGIKYESSKIMAVLVNGSVDASLKVTLTWK